MNTKRTKEEHAEKLLTEIFNDATLKTEKEALKLCFAKETRPSKYCIRKTILLFSEDKFNLNFCMRNGGIGTHKPHTICIWSVKLGIMYVRVSKNQPLFQAIVKELKKQDRGVGEPSHLIMIELTSKKGQNKIPNTYINTHTIYSLTGQQQRSIDGKLSPISDTFARTSFNEFEQFMAHTISMSQS